MEFRKATQEDLNFVSQNPFEGALKNYPYLEVPDDNSYTAIFEGEIVGIGGLSVIWEGVCWMWLMMTADCEKNGLNGIIAIFAIREKMEELLETNNIKRAQAAIRTDFPKAIEMIESLGFGREGLMRKYWPDSTDAYLYARII